MAVERIRILPYRLRGKQSLFHRETSSSTLKGKTDSKADHRVPDQVGGVFSVWSFDADLCILDRFVKNDLLALSFRDLVWRDCPVHRNTSDIEWITFADEYECRYKSFMWSSAYAFHDKKTPNDYIFAQIPILFLISGWDSGTVAWHSST